jgi:hypothetical protein
MGRWGPGNFDDDISRDYLADVIGYFEAGESPESITGMNFTPGVSSAGGGCLVPTLAIMCALHEALGSNYLPSPQTVERWKERYLQLFDQPNADTDWPKAKAERRKVVEQTFDRLLEHCHRRASGSSG